MLTVPYLTPAAFRAHPTYLDTMSLRPGDSDIADQDAALNNILLMASADADNYVEMSADGTGSLSAHVRVENTRIRVSPDGSLKYKPDHTPVTQLLGLSTGSTPGALVATDLATAQWWIEKTNTIVAFLALAGPAMSAFQFGGAAPTAQLFTKWMYVAGFANTRVAATASAGASSLLVTDTTGITAGTTLRLWDPGVEEAVTVAAGYVLGNTTLPLTTPLQHAHEPGAGAFAGGADIIEAVVNFACVKLIRPDSGEEDTYPGTKTQPTTRNGGAHDGSSLMDTAAALLEPYRRVR